MAEVVQPLTHLADDTPTPVLVTDQWGIIHEVNQAAVAFFNIPPDRLIRKPLAVFISSQERYGFRVLIHRLVSGANLDTVDSVG